MASDRISAQLRTIRAAGLSRVRREALRLGVATVERDFKIMRDVANGSVPQAAERSGCSQTTVIRALNRYEAIAQALIQRSRMRRKNSPEAEAGAERIDSHGKEETQ